MDCQRRRQVVQFIPCSGAAVVDGAAPVQNIATRSVDFQRPCTPGRRKAKIGDTPALSCLSSCVERSRDSALRLSELKVSTLEIATTRPVTGKFASGVGNMRICARRVRNALRRRPILDINDAALRRGNVNTGEKSERVVCILKSWYSVDWKRWLGAISVVLTSRKMQ